MDDRGPGSARHLQPRARRRHRPRAQPGDPHLPRLRHAAHRRPRRPAGDAHRPLLRLRPPRARRRPQRVRRDDAVPRAPRQRARQRRRLRGRREGHQARPRAVRERHSPRRDGGEVAHADGGLEDQGGEAAAPLPGGGPGVARRRRARAVRHQPPVRRPLRRGRGLRRPRRSRERLRRLEVDRAAHGGGVRAPLRRGPRGAGAAHRRTAEPAGAARHPAGLRRLPAGARAAREEAAALPAVPRRHERRCAHPRRPHAGGARRGGLAHSGLGQVADDALARDEAPALAGAAQPDDRRRHRPHAARPPDHQHLPRRLRLRRARARRQHPGAARAAAHEQRPHGDDDDPEVRGGAGRRLQATSRTSPTPTTSS